MLNEYDHAAKLRQSCENMKKFRHAAMQSKSKGWQGSNSIWKVATIYRRRPRLTL